MGGAHNRFSTFFHLNNATESSSIFTFIKILMKFSKEKTGKFKQVNLIVFIKNEKEISACNRKSRCFYVKNACKWSKTCNIVYHSGGSVVLGTRLSSLADLFQFVGMLNVDARTSTRAWIERKVCRFGILSIKPFFSLKMEWKKCFFFECTIKSASLRTWKFHNCWRTCNLYIMHQTMAIC